VRQIYEELRTALGTSLISYPYCALARWPEFFASYWKELKVAISSPMYEGIRNGIRITAWTLAQEMPYPVDLTTTGLAGGGLSDEDFTSIARLTEVFVGILSSSVLNTALACIALEGGTQKRRVAPKTVEAGISGDERAA
jgi:hypothetical protein